MGKPQIDPQGEPSTGQLMTQLSEQTSQLVRDEVQLAKAELKESLKHAGAGAGLFSAAGLFAVSGWAILLAAAVLALGLVLPMWAAALIVAGVLFLIAAIAGLTGKKQIDQASPTPERAVENVKRDIDQVKEGHHHGTST